MDIQGYQRLAKQFTENAVKIKAGDRLLINTRGARTMPFAQQCKLHAEGLGAHVTIRDSGSVSINEALTNATPAEIAAYGRSELDAMKNTDCYIGIGDDWDMKAVNNRALYMKTIREGLNYRVNHTRWVITRAPTEDFANACGMSVPEFDAFFLKACLLDYDRMAKAVVPLKDLMDRSEKVRIVGRDTDLSFSIKGLGAVPCVGARNIPDGECYTSPVLGSLNGKIHFGPSTYMGESFGYMDIEYTNGIITSAVAANAQETANLNRILDTDAGARQPGEFAIGFHPHISKPVGNILFDEKIGGSIHIAQGKAYENEADNGNRSEIHWDMVHSQRPEHGGGELYFDDKLIRKDGRFVLPELDGLNPENLL